MDLVVVVLAILFELAVLLDIFLDVVHYFFDVAELHVLEDLLVAWPVFDDFAQQLAGLFRNFIVLAQEVQVPDDVDPDELMVHQSHHFLLAIVVVPAAFIFYLNINIFYFLLIYFLFKNI